MKVVVGDEGSRALRGGKPGAGKGQHRWALEGSCRGAPSVHSHAWCAHGTVVLMETSTSRLGFEPKLLVSLDPALWIHEYLHTSA